MIKTQILSLILFVSVLPFNITAQTNGSIFRIDPGHTNISFSVERFGMVMVTGRFTEVSGTVQYLEESPAATSADITIAVNSLYSGHEVRDGHLKGETWLHAEKFPEITFKSTALKENGDQHLVSAELTIHGVTNEVSFPVEIRGPYTDPTKTNTISIRGDLIIDRQDYGISFSRTLDNGKLFIGNEVKIHFDALAAQDK